MENEKGWVGDVRLVCNPRVCGVRGWVSCKKGKRKKGQRSNHRLSLIETSTVEGPVVFASNSLGVICTFLQYTWQLRLVDGWSSLQLMHFGGQSSGWSFVIWSSSPHMWQR
jgi:hypothetical protein